MCWTKAPPELRAREPAANNDAAIAEQPLDKDALRKLEEELLGKLRRAGG